MSHIFTTTLRLNLDNADDRKAWEHLQRLDRAQHRSYSKAIVAAVNGFFDRERKFADDPYLETREKEDAFLARVMEAVATGLRSVPVITLPSCPPSAAVERPDEDMAAALDFADSF